MGALQRALLPGPARPLAAGAVDPAVALRCCAAWAACGVPFAVLQQSYPTLAASLISALDPRASSGAALDGARLSQASLAAGVLRACLQCSLDSNEEVELSECSSLLGVLIHWAPAIGNLGAPTIDADGMSDGGGALGGVCAELACNLVAVASLSLEVLAASDLPDVLDASGGESAAAQIAAGLVRGTIEILLACSLHTLPAPAELAAEGWFCLAAALPPTEAPWRSELFSLVYQRTLQRCSRAQLRSGSGEDADDLQGWRERCGAPLLSACSEIVGAATCLAPLLGVTRVATACASEGSGENTPIAAAACAGIDAETLELALFAGTCMGPGCLRAWATETHAEALEITRRANEICARSLPQGDSLSVGIATQAAACSRAMQQALLQRDSCSGAV
jgi:hypothetical protein